MAMNFLRVLNTSLSGGDADGGGPLSGGSGSSNNRRSARLAAVADGPATRHALFLLGKVATMALAEDQRATMDECVAHVRAHQGEIALDAPSLHTLLQIARSIRADKHAQANVDLSLAALEILKMLLTPPEGAAGTGGAEDGTAASSSSSTASATHAALVSLFLSQPSHVSCLLELLGEQHSVLRLYAMQCLTALLRTRAEKVQSLVLAAPMGVTSLVELLSSRAEVIRNEALLLLEALTRRHAAIQKIVAFQGALSQLFTIAEEEGGAHDGGIIAEDAMRLIAQLLQDNASNQALFLDQGCVARCVPYLRFAEEDLGPDAPGAHFEFLGLTLDILGHVTACIDFAPTAPKHKNTSSRSSLAPLLEPLMKLAAGSRHVPVAVRHECWSLLAVITEGHARNQAALEALRVEVDVIDTQQSQMQQQASGQAASALVYKRVRRNALRQTLEVSVDSSDALERALSLFLLRAYLKDNPRGQLQSMMSFAPSPVGMGLAQMQQQQQQLQQGGMESFGSEQAQAAALAAAAVPEEDVDGPALGVHLLPMLSGQRPLSLSLSSTTASSTPITQAEYTDRCRAVASQLLEAMVYDNPDCQLLMLRVQPAATAPATANAAPDVAPPAKLLDHSISALFSSQNHSNGVEVALLSLLCAWADGCVEMQEVVFGRYASSLLAYMVQMARDPHVVPTVRGLATYFIALALELISNPPPPQQARNGNGSSSAPVAAQPFSSPILTPALLLDLITRQISLDGFKSNLAALHSSALFQHAQRLGDNRKANPLNLWRALESEWNQAHGVGVGATPNPSQPVVELTEQQELEREYAVQSSLQQALSLTHAFSVRFQTVYDKCDQRLLSLFTSAASAPAIAQQSQQQHGSASQPSSHTGSTQAHASAPSSSQQAPPARSGGPASPSSSSASSSAVEQQLREENARLQQELQLLKAAAGGQGADVSRQFQQLQQELQTTRQQLQQAQADLQAARAAVAAASSSATAAQPSTDSAAVAGDLARVRAEYAELLLEHEDLLILLASQELELQGKQGAGADSLPHPTTAAVSTTPSHTAGPPAAAVPQPIIAASAAPAVAVNSAVSSSSTAGGSSHVQQPHVQQQQQKHQQAHASDTRQHAALQPQHPQPQQSQHSPHAQQSSIQQPQHHSPSSLASQQSSKPAFSLLPPHPQQHAAAPASSPAASPLAAASPASRPAMPHQAQSQAPAHSPAQSQQQHYSPPHHQQQAPQHWQQPQMPPSQQPQPQQQPAYNHHVPNGNSHHTWQPSPQNRYAQNGAVPQHANHETIDLR